MKVKSYTELIVWQKAMEFVVCMYRATQRFPKEELYGLTSQLRRSEVSVPSNIAEGQSRLSTAEFRHFLGNAKGSLSELQTQVTIAGLLNYIEAEQTSDLLKRLDEISRMPSGLLNSPNEINNKRASRGMNSPLATHHSSL